MTTSDTAFQQGWVDHLIGQFGTATLQASTTAMAGSTEVAQFYDAHVPDGAVAAA